MATTITKDNSCCWTATKVTNVSALREGLFSASVELAKLAMGINVSNEDIIGGHPQRKFCAQHVAQHIRDEYERIYAELEEKMSPFLNECQQFSTDTFLAKLMEQMREQEKQDPEQPKLFGIVGKKEVRGNMLEVLTDLLEARLKEEEEQA